MMKTLEAIQAIYENGLFRPLEQVHLEDLHRVWLIYFPADERAIYPLHDDLPADALVRLAESSGSLDFLADPAENLYTLEDGEEV